MKMKAALSRLFKSIFPDEEVPDSLATLVDVFIALEDPLVGYSCEQTKGGAEAALLIALAHGVESSVLEEVAASFPTDADGKEVALAPFAKSAKKFARRITSYLEKRQAKLAAEASQVKAAAEVKSADDA